MKATNILKQVLKENNVQNCGILSSNENETTAQFIRCFGVNAKLVAGRGLDGKPRQWFYREISPLKGVDEFWGVPDMLVKRGNVTFEVYEIEE